MEKNSFLKQFVNYKTLVYSYAATCMQQCTDIKFQLHAGSIIMKMVFKNSETSCLTSRIH